MLFRDTDVEGRSMPWSPPRLVQKRWKALYIVGGLALSIGLFRLLTLLPSIEARLILGTIAQSAWIYYGTRIFRGPSELLTPPRPWWRMTSRPLAGFLLGALFVALTAESIVRPLVDPARLFDWTAVVEYSAFGGLYLASSARLRRESSPRRSAPAAPSGARPETPAPPSAARP